MNTQERWNYIKNNEEIILQYMAQHDEEVKTRQLVKFLREGINKMNFDIEYLVIRLHDIAREVEQQVGVGELSQDIRACADRLSELNKAK
jgi:uncharacterized protein YecA (UPF0149 family)